VDTALMLLERLDIEVAPSGRRKPAPASGRAPQLSLGDRACLGTATRLKAVR